MWICTDCKEEFSSPNQTVYEEPCEYWGAQVSETIVVQTCPYCGSEDIEEVQACQICGSATPSYDKDFCEQCHRDFEGDLEQLKHDYKIDQDQLKDLITEHFGW